MSYQFIENSTSKGMMKVADLRYSKDDKHDYYLAKFPRQRWIFFENQFYYRDIKLIKERDEKTLKIYKGISSVPKYVIHRDSKKIGFALPRITKDEERKYLFIPSTKISNSMRMKGINKKTISRDYFIYEINDEYIINKENSRLLRYL
mgnify:CR=1 FL=1|tara:strand:- start:161 stop:604 length:444 start_codon:yes stop_codon:yes gene_type:complete